MNLHDEVLRTINQVGQSKLIAIHISVFGEPGHKTEYGLSLGHNEDQLKEFLREIDFEYSDHKSIYGCIWFVDNLWAEKNAGPNIDGYWHFYSYPKLTELVTANQGVKIIES